jgi:hypothetical protein
MTSTAYVATLPECDIHHYDMNVLGVPAEYDAPTKRGPWASMCESCWQANRVSADLGTGKGQKYVVGEPPARDRHAEAQAAAEAGDIDAFFEACGDGDPLDFL